MFNSRTQKPLEVRNCVFCVRIRYPIAFLSEQVFSRVQKGKTDYALHLQKLVNKPSSINIQTCVCFIAVFNLYVGLCMSLTLTRW